MTARIFFKVKYFLDETVKIHPFFHLQKTNHKKIIKQEEAAGDAKNVSFFTWPNQDFPMEVTFAT